MSPEEARKLIAEARERAAGNERRKDGTWVDSAIVIPALCDLLERALAVVEAARLPHNTTIKPGEEFVEPNDWICVPREDFEALRAALARYEAKEKQ